MKDINTRFCQKLLAQAKLDLTGRELKHFNQNVGCLKLSGAGGWYFVEWPNMGEAGRTFSVEVQADNAYDAKAQAIRKWLDTQATAARQRHNETGFPGEHI